MTVALREGKYYVYQLRLACSPTPFYIGKGHGNRMKHHFFPSNLAKNSHKSNTINKALRDGVRVLCEVLLSTDDELEAFRAEAEQIAMYGRADLGTGVLTNLTDGGEGASGKKVSATTKAKLSASKLGKPVSDATRANMSQAKRAMSQETKDKMSLACAGKPRSERWKASHKEAIARRYESQPSPLKGRTLTEEHKAKIRAGVLARQLKQRNE